MQSKSSCHSIKFLLNIFKTVGSAVDSATVSQQEDLGLNLPGDCLQGLHVLFVGALQMLPYPPTVQRQTREVNL